MIAEQVEQRHGQILAGRDRTPAPDRVHADRDAALGHEIRVLTPAQCQIGDLRIAVEHGLLIDLLLRRHHRFAHEVDRQVELPLLTAVGQHVLDGCNHAFGLQVTAAEPERSRVQRGHVAKRLVTRKSRVRRRLAIAAVLKTFTERRAYLANQGQIGSERLVDALEHRNALFAPQNVAKQVARKRPEHEQVYDADFDATTLAQVVRDRLRCRDKTSLAEDQVVCVLHAVRHDS